VALPGSYTAIVGPNGAGKTTLLNVITGLIRPEGDGSAARIGTVAIGHVPRNVLARHIRAMDSTPVTFTGTARENLMLLEPDATPEQIHWACEIAQIAYPLDRPAKQLSTGEKVKLLVAQIVLTRPSVLLLDEGLKHVHPTARANLRMSLRRELPQSAIFEVIHEGAVRSRAVTGIVVIDGGVIAERGTHDDLIARKGLYARYVADAAR
jgi:ABC-type multidrug transport system fused ATPase/permease subunit